jgi:hypothetical protein
VLVSEDRPQGPAAKLAHLLESLDSADRQEVVAWLIGRAPSTVGWSTAARMQHVGMPPLVGFPSAEAAQASTALRGLATGEANQLVTVRLPTEQHERLRTWCAEHNFTMAAVIRGLIERFLDDQSRPQ